MKALRTVFSLLLLLAVFSPARNAPAQAPDTFCGYDPDVAAYLGNVQFADWSGWVRGLSGDIPVQVGGQTKTITTRYSPYLFDGSSPAYDYVLEQIRAWYPESQIEEDPYEVNYYGEWKNLVLTIPGTVFPEEVVILSAHLDDTSDKLFAPGADDNATGSAALLEAARVLRPQAGMTPGFPRTLRIIWFTGEEYGMWGSEAYTADHPLENVIGVINLDMFGYDHDGDRCFELHVGTLPQSQPVGQCFLSALSAYASDLQPEYLTSSATNRSDHSSFWYQGVGALQVSENFFLNSGDSSCSYVQDQNPNYHHDGDTYANMHPEFGFAVARAGLAAAFSLASEGPQNYIYFPFLTMLKIKE